MTMTPAEVSQRLASIMTELADLADVLDCDLGLVPPADTLDEVCYKISDARRFNRSVLSN